MRTQPPRKPIPDGTWRDYFAPIVSELLEMVRTCKMSQQHAMMEFRVAWQLWGNGYCRYWPYRVWRDEVAKAMGWRRGRLTPRSKYAPEWYRQYVLEQAGQQRLFAA